MTYDTSSHTMVNYYRKDSLYVQYNKNNLLLGNVMNTLKCINSELLVNELEADLVEISALELRVYDLDKVEKHVTSTGGLDTDYYNNLPEYMAENYAIFNNCFASDKALLATIHLAKEGLMNKIMKLVKKAVLNLASTTKIFFRKVNMVQGAMERRVKQVRLSNIDHRIVADTIVEGFHTDYYTKYLDGICTCPSPFQVILNAVIADEPERINRASADMVSLFDADSTHRQVRYVKATLNTHQFTPSDILSTIPRMRIGVNKNAEIERALKRFVTNMNLKLSELDITNRRPYLTQVHDLVKVSFKVVSKLVNQTSHMLEACEKATL